MATGKARFGAHVSISGGVFKAPQNGVESGCDLVQIFTTNQRQWRVKPLADEDIKRFKQEEIRTGVEAVCVHASYLINLGGFDAFKLQQSHDAFATELHRADQLGIPFLVVHPGSHLGEGEANGMKQISDSLNVVLAQLPDCGTKVLLEATAGQGSNLGYTFEQLAAIKDGVEARERVGFCIDTCHIFAAGYELRNPGGYEKTLAQLDDLLSAGEVGIVHVNDSKFGLGSKRDRHDNIGAGELGLEAFRLLVNDERLRDVPFIIETPGGPEKDQENLAKLRDLVA